MRDRDLCDRLKRYSTKCLAERLDPDFADAVKEAIEIIHFMNNTITTDKIKDHALYTDEFGLLTEKKPVKHGKNLDEKWPSLFKCSICHWSCWDTYCGDTDIYNYCPNCGARMDAED